MVELAICYGYTRLRYDYRLTWPVILYSAFQLSLGVVVFFAAQQQNTLLHWFVGGAGCAVSIGFSIFILRKKTSLWNVLKQRVLQRLHHG